MSKDYSQELVKEIQSVLEDQGWKFSFDEENGMFKFGTKLESKIRSISYYISVRSDAYVVYAVSPISADADDENMMVNMAMFICSANYGLKAGNFELDLNDGEIRFKVFVNCTGTVPSHDIIKSSVIVPAISFDTYGDGIVNVIYNNASGKAEAERCENSRIDGIQRRFRAALQNSGASADESARLEEFLAFLQERMGSADSASNEDDSENK